MLHLVRRAGEWSQGEGKVSAYLSLTGAALAQTDLTHAAGVVIQVPPLYRHPVHSPQITLLLPSNFIFPAKPE